MATGNSEEFHRDPVRIATGIGLTKPEGCIRFEGRVSTLNKWVWKHQPDDLMSGPHEDAEKEVWPVAFVFRVMKVTSRGFRA